MKKIQFSIIPSLMAAICLVTSVGCAEMATIRVGLVRGNLSPCPETPNCVSSMVDESDQDHYIAPIDYPASVSDPLAILQNVVENASRTEIVVSNDRYVHATYKTFFFRFIDDVEFLIDAPNNVVHIKSASRIGYSDVGTNRRRINSIRSDFNEMIKE